ncbi:GNAT family N-acetyltransferase [Photobacterium sp. GJ3]|uniref:GNAT family N-acetyltransferase n=1 Tax=Photobacterium sp. GJ3 TaxID=2829502 RepID=UPI001B8D7F40|nr:GNAT family N-acetyltransferase [Photobacterium sp. GJ3]QUJ68767.1 GNAT family N-acetyltransferase [Photobacterium sp. GJ3]
MNQQEVMAAYNHYERITIEIPGFEKSLSDGLVRFRSAQAQGGFISFFDLDENNLSSVIHRQIAYFSEGAPFFEWKTYSTDQPASIGQYLTSHGFQQGAPESFMVLDLAEVTPVRPSPGLITEVHDFKGIQDAMKVQEAVWQTDQSDHLDNLLYLKQTQPDTVSVYVIYEQEEPVSSAWIIFNGQSPFAGVWGGSTIARCRGKGYYTALLQQRIDDACRRGKRYLTIDASEMSRPIVARHGFQWVAETVPYIYRAPEMS